MPNPTEPGPPKYLRTACPNVFPAFLFCWYTIYECLSECQGTAGSPRTAGIYSFGLAGGCHIIGTLCCDNADLRVVASVHSKPISHIPHKSYGRRLQHRDGTVFLTRKWSCEIGRMRFDYCSHRGLHEQYFETGSKGRARDAPDSWPIKRDEPPRSSLCAAQERDR